MIAKSAETISGHVIRSLTEMRERLTEAEKGGKNAVNEEAGNIEAELDRLTSLLAKKEHIA